MPPRIRVAALALALALTLPLASCGGQEISPPRAHAVDGDERDAAAEQLLDRLARDLNRHDTVPSGRFAAPGSAARRAVSTILANGAALDLRRVSFDLVDEVPPTSAAVRAYGRDAFAATVSTSWQLGRYDDVPTHLDTRFVFADTDSGVGLVRSGGGSDRSVLWLVRRLQVRTSPSSLVMAVGPRAARLGQLARRAVRDVRRVLHGWRGRLVLEAPASQAQLDSMLGSSAGEYANIAAVTTSVDGSLSPDSPVHVFVNPAVFDPLGPRGAQVVISHEAVHVATGATSASVPPWLLEGFADYVALVHTDIPVSLAARQVLAQVRREGPPRGLPTPTDLAPSATRLGATYEAAWTACRYMGERFGQARVVAFYRAVDAGASTQRAFRTVLGIRQARFVRGWRADLRRLAG